jgi:hypothetical protein
MVTMVQIDSFTVAGLGQMAYFIPAAIQPLLRHRLLVNSAGNSL